MQKILQTGLSAGMSSASGYHSSKPKPCPRELDGANLQPSSFQPTPSSRISFPVAKGSPVEASPICIGAWSWGDTATWHWDHETEWPRVQAAFQHLISSGINFFDTAQAYGNGKSEELLGELIKANNLPRDSYVIQTKWLGNMTQVSNLTHPSDAPYHTLKGSLKRLGLDYIDIYLVHGPIHIQSIASVAKSLHRCVEDGLTKAVGVANYDPDDLLKMQEELEKGIVFQGYSSLAQGRLTGKYTQEHAPPKTYRFSSYDMGDIRQTVDTVKEVALKRGKEMASVALNWSVCKGAVPVVGIRNLEQARQAVDALGWRLTEEEMRQIDAVSVEGNRTALWQQG
ncbi:aldo-keto reductase [Rhypophila decipiens]|uniref:Aldo-keto reductase n=1 Tax=Rhypophila decipiens TaxID=261697 RepID=A0AAN6YDZ6_9PEZI|nr:aldo-keto reductase [Rhypophila decipiens]